MQVFELAITVSFQKIFSYYGYTAVRQNETYRAYAVGSAQATYYLFNEPDKDQLSVFSVRIFQTVSKSELLVELSGKESIDQILNDISLIDNIPTDKEKTVISKAVTPADLLMIILSLSKLEPTPGAWHSTPQFAERVFTSGSPAGGFRVPLCIYNERKFVRFTNMVEWNAEQFTFSNNRSDGFFTSNFLSSNTKLLITSNPHAWEKMAVASYAPEFLFLICYPSVTLITFQTIQHLYKKNSFSEILFPIANFQHDLQFVLELISLFLNYENEKIAFTFSTNDESLMLQLEVTNDQRMINTVTRFLSQVDLGFDELFYAGMKNEYIVSGNILKKNKLQVKRVNKTKNVMYFLNFELKERKVISFLKTLADQFLKEVVMTFVKA